MLGARTERLPFKSSYGRASGLLQLPPQARRMRPRSLPALVGLVLALGDYAFQRRTVMKQLRMTPREIKDENRQTEGDPMVKGAIRSRQMAMSRNRMLAAVAAGTLAFPDAARPVGERRAMPDD